jgi:hypothetical protein
LSWFNADGPLKGVGNMKKFLEILTNVRIAGSEIGGTLTLLLLIAYGLYKAWQEFIVPLR